MASSKNLPNDLIFRVEAVLHSRVKPGARLVVGLSGGLDSVVLLDILDALRARLGFHLSAIHINHQISSHAPAWAEFCQALCARRQIPLGVVAVDLQHRHGLGLEAAARAARYQAFAARPEEFVVLAQHQDDQAETVLLQLLRGAGAKGLSAMPQLRHEAARSDVAYLRPLLQATRAEILAYAQAHGLDWVEDESNADTVYDRNFLRHRAFPLLIERFPACRATLARSARHLAEAAQLLEELARLDAAHAIPAGKLNLDALSAMPEARARNLLRFWLAQAGVAAPGSERLGEVLRQLTTAAQDAEICLSVGQHEIRRFRGEACLVPLLASVVPHAVWDWHGEAQLRLDSLQVDLGFSEMPGRGISLAKLRAAPVTLRLRQGGEHFQPACNRPRRSLKNLLQESGVPPWERERLPLLYSGKHLVWVPGVGVDCAFQAAAGEPGVVLQMAANGWAPPPHLSPSP